MSLLRLLLNVLWILTGGLWMAVGWLIAAVLMIITIVCLPWARAAFNIASYTIAGKQYDQPNNNHDNKEQRKIKPAASRNRSRGCWASGPYSAKVRSSRSTSAESWRTAALWAS